MREPLSRTPPLRAPEPSRVPGPTPRRSLPSGILALQRAAGNTATRQFLSGGTDGSRRLLRIANDPAAIRAEWDRVIKLFTSANKLTGQNINLDRLRDRTIANQWFNDNEWASMVMGVSQKLEQAVNPPPGAFMTIMERQLDTKFRPERSAAQKAHYKQSAKPVKGPTRTRKDALKADWKNAAAAGTIGWDTLTDPELAYMIRQIDKASVDSRAGSIGAVTGAVATPNQTRVPVACYYLWNANGGAQRVRDDLADANTVYNRKGIHVDPMFIRQLTRADVEGALGHRVDDAFYLDFRGVDEGAHDAHHHGHAKKPKYKDADTRKLMERYMPTTMIGALWTGDMIADAGRSPGKSNDAREKWVVVNTAYMRNRAIFPHELGHLVFESAHPQAGVEDTPGHAFTDEPAGAADDEKSISLRHNVLTSGGTMDLLWALASPTPADIFVSPGQSARAHQSALAYHT